MLVREALMKKKVVKRYEVTRATICARLDALQDKLRQLDVLNTAPNDVEDELEDLAAELGELSDQVDSEA